jgi:hypothetical protein
MARLTFPKFDPKVTLDNNPVSDDPVIKRLTKIFKDAMVVRDRLHDAHAKLFNIAGGHSWVAPKDPKVIKAMKDAKKDVDDARDELRQAFKERGIDIAAQHQANMDLLDKISAQTRESLRKMGLGETLERLEHRNAPMNMKHLIERCERDLSEAESHTDGQKNANYEAETCKKHGGKGCPSCADGYRMSDEGKCVKAKGLGNLWKRASSSEKGVAFPDQLGHHLDRENDKAGGKFDMKYRMGNTVLSGARKIKIR